MDITNNVLLLIFIVICMVAVVTVFINKKEKLYVKEAFIGDGKGYAIALIIIAAIAIFVRVWRFGEIPGGFNQDGAMAAVDAKALADYGTDRFGMRFPVHFTAWGYGQMSVLASYFMVPFIKLFGLNEITARLPLLIASIAGLAVLFLFIKEITKDRIITIIIFAFCAINPWHIMQSRWVLDCNLFPHIFLFGLYFLNKGIHKKIYIYISMAFFALSLYCYGIALYSVPVFLLFMCLYMLWKKYISLKQAGIALAVFTIISLPIFAMVFINFFRLETIQTPFLTIPFFPGSVRSKDLLFFSDSPLNDLLQNVKTLFDVSILRAYDGLPWNVIPKFGAYYIPTLPFVFLGLFAIIKKIRETKDNFGLVCIIGALGISIWAGLITKVNINRINIIFYPLIIIAGYGIAFAIKNRRYLSIFLVSAYCFLFGMFSFTYFTSYAKVYDRCFFKDFGNAVKYAKTIDCDTYYITAYSQFETSDYVSEILTLFYHDIDAKYFQGEKQLIGPEGDIKLPYNERYKYFTDKNIEYHSGDCVYVLRDSQKQLFDEDKFSFFEFGNYYVAVSK